MFNVLFSMIPASVPDFCGQGHGLLKKAIAPAGYITSPTRHFVLFIKFIENFQLCYMFLLKYMYMTVCIYV